MTFSSFFETFSGRRNPDISVRGRSYPLASLLRGEHHYDPTQPRVPAGHSDGGQWTRENYGAGIPRADKHHVLSDAIPDHLWKPGAQYATRRGTGRGGTIPPTEGQLIRLAAAEARANAAMREIRERDPRWQPSQSVYATVEGQIAAAEARALEAEAYLSELMTVQIGPPRFVCEWIPARGASRRLYADERKELNRLGDKNGCSTCGTKNPGTRSGNWIGDHQPSNVINEILKKPQRLYPQCKSCSDKQGNWLSRWRRKP